MQDLAIEYFKKISNIPRCSGNFLGISEFISSEAKKFGHSVSFDKANNLLVKIKKNNGSKIDPVILQAHMDMVCEKEKSSFHDFLKDPIEIIEENGYFRAKGTTLGADNGVGLAIMMAFMNEEQKIKHPDVELLFTVDEEIGLIGAFNLDPKLLKGKTLINLDGDEEGVFLVGCAGSLLLKMDFLPNLVKATKMQGIEIIFKGFKGGHSGAEIDKDLANPLKLIFYFLNELNLKIDFELSSITGGEKTNSIPREAKAIILVHEKDICLINDEILVFINRVKKMYPIEDNFKIVFIKVEACSEVFEKSNKEKFLSIGMVIMHGIYKVENYKERLIRTSLNFAILKRDFGFKFYLSIRSLFDTDKEYIYSNLKAISNLAGAKIEVVYNYPAWNSKSNSRLINHLKTVYKNEYKKFPKISSVHAGLETGIIYSK